MFLKEHPGGGFTIKSGSHHDDYAMALCACVIPLRERQIVERCQPGSIEFPQQEPTLYTGINPPGM